MSCASERPIGLVRGTRDWLPDQFAELPALQALLMDRFARAGYEPMRAPVLEFAELHERKSGAGVVAKLVGVESAGPGRVCLRPELTASIVRAYIAAPDPPPLPFRVSMAGPVFEAAEPAESTQVGVELLGAGGPAADAEVIWLADWSLREAGIAAPGVRIGHVGLILELLERSGLPQAARGALVEMLSEAAAEGRGVRALEAAIERLSAWLGADVAAEEVLPSVAAADDPGVDRLFRHLVPDVIGRRSGHEIIGRLRRKWDLSHTSREVLARLHDQIVALAELRGPAARVLDRLRGDFAPLAPGSVAELLDLVATLDDYGVSPERIELDLGFGRGIGFYSQMIFELTAPTPEGPVEVCGGGRYDGLARVLGSDRDPRGVGFAFELETLCDALARYGVQSTRQESWQGALVVPEAEPQRAEAIHLATRLRQRGHRLVLGEPAPIEQAYEQAFARRLAAVVVVKGEAGGAECLWLHDLRTRRAVPVTAEALARDLDLRRGGAS